MRVAVFLAVACAGLSASAATLHSPVASDYVMPWGGFTGNWAKMPEGENLRLGHRIASAPALLTSFSLQAYSAEPLLIRLVAPGQTGVHEFAMLLPQPPAEFDHADYTTTTVAVPSLPLVGGEVFELRPTAPLYLRVLDDYPANQGAPRFSINHFSNAVNGFSRWQSFAMDPGVGWEVQSLAADITRDGVVNRADHVHLVRHFGQTDLLGRYDLDGDRLVTLKDWIIIKNDQGARIDRGLGTLAVPEPATGASLLAGVLFLFVLSLPRLRRSFFHHGGPAR